MASQNDGYKVLVSNQNNSNKYAQRYRNNSTFLIKSPSGYIQLRVQLDNQFNSDETVQYYDSSTSTWADCIGIPTRKRKQWMKMCGTYILHSFIVNIPKNNKLDICNQAIFFDNKLYAFNNMTHQFVEIAILSSATTKTGELFDDPDTRNQDIKVPIQQIHYSESSFIIWKGYLYELKWNYDAATHPTLLTVKHLKWISTFELICFCDTFGMALTMRAYSIRENKDKNWVDQYNDYLIFYEPTHQIVRRLTENDIQFKELNGRRSNVSEIVWLNKSQSMRLHMQCNITGTWKHETFVFEINQSIFRNMQSRKYNDCYDDEEYIYNASFTAWKPRFDSDAESDKGTNDDFNTYMAKSMGWYKYKSGFKQLKAGLKPEKHATTGDPIPESRGKYLYVCNHPSSNYKIMAGFNLESQCHYNQLRHMQSTNYKQLKDAGDLADYLGAVIWYQEKPCNHEIKVATIVDFQHGLRISNHVIIFNSKYGWPATLYLDHTAWIGVIDSEDPHNSYNKPPVGIPSMRYHVPAVSLKGIRAGKCSNCGKDKNTKACSGCKQIWYCNINCQRMHWKKHKQECQKLLEEALNYFEVIKGRIICADGGFNKGVEFPNVMKGKWYWKATVNQRDQLWDGSGVQQITAYHHSVKYDDQCADASQLQKELLEQVDDNYDDYNEYDEKPMDPDLLPLDTIRTSQNESLKLMKLLYSIKHLQNVVDAMVIKEICEYCYFMSTLNWIEKSVLDGKWYLHRQTIDCRDGRAGIFDYDNFRDVKTIGNPYSGCTGFQWFHFKEKDGNDMDNDFWGEMLKQSLEYENPCSVASGCIGTNDRCGKCECAAKLDPVTKQVMCISIIFDCR